jgi:hypothetical protein
VCANDRCTIVRDCVKEMTTSSCQLVCHTPPSPKSIHACNRGPPALVQGLPHAEPLDGMGQLGLIHLRAGMRSLMFANDDSLVPIMHVGTMSWRRGVRLQSEGDVHVLANIEDVKGVFIGSALSLGSAASLTSTLEGTSITRLQQARPTLASRRALDWRAPASPPLEVHQAGASQGS